MKINNIILSLILIIGTYSFTGCIEKNAIEYEVTFQAFWSEETHPDDFPSNPHFSGLIGASHNENVSFWKVGALASPGIKNMAETGSKTPLNEEITTAILNRTALSFISMGGINPSPGSIRTTFQVSENYPIVTLVSMIAPSPDWFVGVDSLNLYEGSLFVDEKTVILYAYDAGTDSGNNYTSTDEPTNPPIPVFLIDGYPFIYEEEVQPIGNLFFKKLS